jgi:hypothetical protein
MPTSPWTALNEGDARSWVLCYSIHRLAAPGQANKLAVLTRWIGVALSASARTSLICWPGCRRQLPVAVRDWVSATLNAHYGCKPGSKVDATLPALIRDLPTSSASRAGCGDRADEHPGIDTARRDAGAAPVIHSLGGLPAQ